MRLAFAQSGSAIPFIHSAFAPSTYARAKRFRLSPLEGLGDTSTTGIAAIAAQGAATTGGILAGLASMGAIAPYFALAGPIGAAVAGLTAVGIAIANLFSGCGQTCVEATQIANQLQVYWQQNLDHYMQAPVHYYSLQQAAINNFMTGVKALQQACGDPALGDAGQRCISERLDPNACFIKDANGGCHNAWIDFYNPIKNDPNVVPDPVESTSNPVGGAVSSVAGAVSKFPVPLLLIGGGVLAVTLMSD